MKRLLLEPCADCKDLRGMTITSYLLGGTLLLRRFPVNTWLEEITKHSLCHTLSKAFEIYNSMDIGMYVLFSVSLNV